MVLSRKTLRLAILAFSLLLGLLLAGIHMPAAALETISPNSPNTPDEFEAFVEAVNNGESGVLRGVYASGVMALEIVPQPENDPGFVSTTDNVVTNFSQANKNGITGLLAHNTLAGKYFFKLAPGNTVRLVYGDSTVKEFIVTAIYQYRALSPTNPRSDFVDLDTGEWISADALFKRMYTGATHLTFQTCISAEGDSSWGRLFIIAEPMTPPAAPQISE